MKIRINMRLDKYLLEAVDAFLKSLIPKKNRTQFTEQALKNELRREKKKLYRESK